MMSGSALYQTIMVCIAFLFYSMALMTLEILTLLQCAGFGSAFLLAAVLRNRIENRTAKESYDLFPQLRIPALKKYAEKWAKIYVPTGLRKIILYEAPITYPMIGGHQIKYLLVFEFRKIKEWLKGEKFIQDNYITPETLFDESFSEIYQNNNSPMNYRDFWDFDIIAHEDVNPKHSVILFKK